MQCCFVSDLHGSPRRYERLFEAIAASPPDTVFLGGDLFPSGRRASGGRYSRWEVFFSECFVAGFRELRRTLGETYPRVFVILGNDDRRSIETELRNPEYSGFWTYIHAAWASMQDCEVFGYSYVPPTPFRRKDWERYDVSRYLEAGAIAPEDGVFSVDVDLNEVRHRTIKDDLEELTEGRDLSVSIMLFHTPPWQTSLDRAALDGVMVDHVPLDVHIGSIAVRRLILEKAPLITLHGHVHEAARITGRWKQQLATTWCYTAAHDGKELALVRFNTYEPANAERVLLP